MDTLQELESSESLEDWNRREKSDDLEEKEIDKLFHSSKKYFCE